jgi:SAM-dependent methyltransferase
VKFIHADMKKAAGVDLAGDVFDPHYRATLAAARPASVLCCNMIEHVTDRRQLAKICQQIVRPGGYLIISVPYSFPYHPDPIDTYFRPSPSQLTSLFPDCEVIASNTVDDVRYWDEIRQRPFAERLLLVAKLILHIPLPFYKWPEWKAKIHRLTWLFRPYRVSVVVLRLGNHSSTSQDA